MLVMHEESSSRLQLVEPLWSLRDRASPGRRGLGRARREPALELQRPVPVRGGVRDVIGAVQPWLSRLYKRCARSDQDLAIDQILHAVDDLLYPVAEPYYSQQLKKCDELLHAAQVEKLSVEAMVALLMETLRAKASLPSRLHFYSRVKDRLHTIAPNDVEELLANLQ